MAAIRFQLGDTVIHAKAGDKIVVSLDDDGVYGVVGGRAVAAMNSAFGPICGVSFELDTKGTP